MIPPAAEAADRLRREQEQAAEATQRLLDTGRHPYYIVAPKYVPNSAGIRVLYLLANALTRIGQSAYVVDVGLGGPPGAFQGTELHPPVLTPALAEHHTAAGVVPIVVYPETIEGNPLNAECVVRYILNFPGLLGGSTDFAHTDQVWAYSRVLGRAAGTANVLCMPVSDPREWPRSHEPKDLSLLYAAKFRLFGGITADVPDDAVEITRHIPTGDGLAGLLRRGKALYLYENSALGIEAMLSGCPVAWMPNEHLREPILGDELGLNGFCMGSDPADIGRARESLDEGARRYRGLFPAFWEQLNRFVLSTQNAARPIKAHHLNIPAMAYPEATGMDPAVLSNFVPAAEFAAALEELRRRDVQLAEATELLELVYSSASWRLTSWLRTLTRKLLRRQSRYDYAFGGE